MHFGLLTIAFWSEEVFWRRGPLLTYFCPTLDLPLDGSGRNAKHMHGAMSYLSLPSRGEMIYCWYCSTEASIRFTVGGGMKSIRICLSKIFWLNLHCVRFCPICFYLRVWRGNRSTYNFNHLKYFLRLRPLPKKLRETSWGNVCASDNNNFTTIRYLFARISSDIYNTVFRVWHGAVILKPK